MTATGITRRTLVVDGMNCLARSAFAARGKHVGLSSDDGVPTATLLIFINMISKYVRQEVPDRMVVCWDGGKSTHRLAIYSDYKAARNERPEEEEPERPVAQAKEFLTLAGIHHVEHPGVEADDLVAAYWRGNPAGHRLTILSGDKDFLQLLDGYTEQIRPGTGTDERWTVNRVRTEMQCRPEHIPFIMALTGDSGDGVPGIPGFGHKTACKVLARNEWDLEKALAEDPKLVGQGDAARRNLALVDLRSPMPGVEVSPPPRFTPTDLTSVAAQPLMQFLDRYQLVSIKNRLVERSLWT